jgi:hypothetical protein
MDAALSLSNSPGALSEIFELEVSKITGFASKFSELPHKVWKFTRDRIFCLVRFRVVSLDTVGKMTGKSVEGVR